MKSFITCRSRRRAKQPFWRRYSGFRRIRHFALCLVVLLASSPALTLDPTRSIAQFHHTSWTIADGMPANIWAITQTPDGYLWLGSVNGLYRFDGVRVERIATESLPSPSIRALAATASGGVWIGYERPVGMISYMRNGKLTNYRISSRNSTSVHGFVIGPDNTVWASTPDSILRFDGNKWATIKGNFGFSFSEGSGGVWSFGVARDGVVWSKNLGGLFYLKPGQPQFERAPGYGGGPEGFTTTRDGRLWTTDTRQAQLYPMPDLAKIRPSGRSSDNPGLVLPKAIQGPILLDRDGTLWCTSVGGGGLRRVRTADGKMILDQGADSRGPSVTTNGLSSDLVHTLFEDREGSIWIGTSLGLDRFRPANIVKEPLVPAGFRARFVNKAGDAVFAYSGWSGTASRAVDNTQNLYRIQPGRQPERFISNVGRLRGMFTNERDGSAWLITQKGIQQLAGRTLGKPLPLPDGVDGAAVYSAAYDSEGALWISTFVRGVFSRTDEGWRSFPLVSSVGATGVLIPDTDGSMWIRYSGGNLFRVRDSKTDDFSRNGLNIGDVTFIRPQGKGVVIGGENGIGSFIDGKFRALRASSIPALSGVTGIANTDDGSSWIFTQAGILRTSTKSFEDALAHSDPKRLNFELLDSRDGLPGAPYGAVYGSSIAADASGRVWLTTGNGLVWIDPRNLYHNPIAPNVVVSSLVADKRGYLPRPDITLPAGTSSIEIEFTALSLSIPERVRFRYKLEGVDADWVDAANRRQAFYTRLGPGTYKFQVIAANPNGVWNRDGTSMAITISPYFWQTWLFRTAVLLFVFALLWAFVQWRIRAAGERTRQRVEDRLAVRENIAQDLHDTLLQGFQGVVLRFQSILERLPFGHPVRAELESTLERADDVLLEGRERVRFLREEAGPVALAPLLSKVTEDALGGQLPWKLKESGIARPVSGPAADDIARIVSEAVFNARRHANATALEIAVSFARENVIVSVEDDGTGIEPAVKQAGGRAGHYGLVGMYERAARLGANLSVLDVAPGGTEIRLTIPVRVACP